MMFSPTQLSPAREPLSVEPDMALAAAIAPMQQSRYGCLPVVERGTLVGILTRSDLVDTLHRLFSGQDVIRYAEGT